MKKQKITRILSSLILTSILFTACGPKTIEQQVEIIIKSEDAEERQTISYAIADSLSTRPAELFMGFHSNPIAVEALKDRLTRYSELIIDQPNKTYNILEYTRFIAEPSTQSKYEINQLKIDRIIHALQIDNLNDKCEETLIKVANQHGNIALNKIIDAWYDNKRSSSILNAIKSFDREAILVMLAENNSDFSEQDIITRTERILNDFIDFLHSENLIKTL